MSLRGHHKATTATVQTASLLIVRFGKNLCGLPSAGVRGVFTQQEAGSGESVTSVGITYHDVDLAGRFGITLNSSHPDMRVVLYSNGHTHGAVRVEEVIGMTEVERAECKPLPPQFHEAERCWISGTTFFQERLVLILTPEWILGELGEVVAVGATSRVLSAS